MEEKITLEQKFAYIMIQLRSEFPFYSAIYESVEHNESDKIDTIGATPNEIVYNSKFIETLTKEELLFVVMHEILHIALKHSIRSEGKDRRIWNIACDLYVNKHISDELRINPGESTGDGKIKFPTSGLFVDTIDTEEDFVEKIYKDILDRQQHNKEYRGSGYAKSSGYNKLDIDACESPDDIVASNEPIESQEFEYEKTMIEANTRLKMYGNIHTGHDKLLDNIFNNIEKSEVDWRKILTRFCRKSISNNLSYSSPDKRFM